MCVCTRVCVSGEGGLSSRQETLWLHLISGQVLSIRGRPSVLPLPLRVFTEAFALALNSQALSDASHAPSPRIQAPPFFPSTLSTLSYVGPSSSPPDPQPHLISSLTLQPSDSLPQCPLYPSCPTQQDAATPQIMVPRDTPASFPHKLAPSFLTVMCESPQQDPEQGAAFWLITSLDGELATLQ